MTWNAAPVESEVSLVWTRLKSGGSVLDPGGSSRRDCSHEQAIQSRLRFSSVRRPLFRSVLTRATTNCPPQRSVDGLDISRRVAAHGRCIMQIYGPAHLHGPQSVNAPHAARLTQPAAARAGSSTADTLEISAEAAAASRLHEIPDIRHDRVAAIKAQIQAGTYETADKLDARSMRCWTRSAKPAHSHRVGRCRSNHVIARGPQALAARAFVMRS